MTVNNSKKKNFLYFYIFFIESVLIICTCYSAVPEKGLVGGPPLGK